MCFDISVSDLFPPPGPRLVPWNSEVGRYQFCAWGTFFCCLKSFELFYVEKFISTEIFWGFSLRKFWTSNNNFILALSIQVGDRIGLGMGGMELFLRAWTKSSHISRRILSETNTTQSTPASSTCRRSHTVNHYYDHRYHHYHHHPVISAIIQGAF